MSRRDPEYEAQLEDDLLRLRKRIAVFEGELEACGRDEPRRARFITTTLSIDRESVVSVEAELALLKAP